jgi:hypothetical protein
MPTGSVAHVVQFHVIRGPDQMVGSRNDGGASLLFFALDSDGQMWRGTASDTAQPVWTKVTGPLDAAPAGA